MDRRVEQIARSGQVLSEIKFMQYEDAAATEQCSRAEGILTGDLAASSSNGSSQVIFRMAQIETDLRRLKNNRKDS
jgi:hypothetical protein